MTTISYIPKLLRALSLRETDPMSALSPLRDGTTTPRTGPHRYKWVNAWKITRRLPVLNHIRRWLYKEGLGLLDYVERRSAQGILPVVSRSTKPIRAQSEDTTKVNTPPEASNSTCSRKGSDIKRPFPIPPYRMAWWKGLIEWSKRGWRQCSKKPE